MQTVIVKAPRSFVDGVLWPEFQELSSALTAYLAEITEKLIREEVYVETREAEEVDEPRLSADEIAGAPCALMPGLLYFHRAMSQFLPL